MAFDMNEFLMSPGYAMATQALNNIYGLRRNQVPTASPADAYQQTVQRRVQLQAMEQMQRVREAQEERMRAQESRAAQMHPLALQQAEQKLDPTIVYEQLVAENYIDPTEMSYQDYMMLGRSNAIPSSVKEWEYYSRLPAKQKTDYLTMKRATQFLSGPAGTTQQFDPTRGGAQQIPGAATVSDMVSGAQQMAAGQESGSQGAKTDAAQVNEGIEKVWSAGEAYNNATNLVQDSKKYLSMLENGQVDTGFIPNLMMNWFGVGTEEMGELNAETIQQGLANLGIANLAPVTEQEFAAVMKLWADLGLEEEPNIGAVRRAINRTERLQRKLQADARVNAERVKRYGGDAEFNNLLSVNPFLQQLYGQDTNASPETPQASPATVNDDIPTVDVVEEWVIDAQGSAVRVK